MQDNQQPYYESQLENDSNLIDRTHFKDRRRNRSRDNDDRNNNLRQDQDDEEDQSNSQQAKGINIDDVTTDSKVASCIRSIFIKFFGEVGRQKGFVFTPQEREKLKAEQKKLKKKSNHSEITWKSECEWFYQRQSAAIQKLFENEKLTINQSQAKIMKKIFLESSFIFGDETTPQLYRIMMRLLKISLLERSQTKIQIEELMTDMLMRTNVVYKFFNFQFSNRIKLAKSKDHPSIVAAYRTLFTSIVKCFTKGLTLQVQEQNEQQNEQNEQ